MDKINGMNRTGGLLLTDLNIGSLWRRYVFPFIAHISIPYKGDVVTEEAVFQGLAKSQLRWGKPPWWTLIKSPVSALLLHHRQPGWTTPQFPQPLFTVVFALA